MKLRSKIMIICSVVIVLSIIAADFALLSLSRNMMLDELNSDGYVEALKVFGEFELFIKRIGAIDNDKLLYYMKTARDNYSVLFRLENGIVTEIFNNTVFSYNKLADGIYEEVADNITKCDFTYYDKRLALYRYNGSSFSLFHFYDMTDDYRRLDMLTLAVIAASVAVLVAAHLILYFILKQSLKPLGKLVSGAKDISAGDYGKRIEVSSTDELGLLSEEFNKMAESVEARECKLAEENERRKLFMGNLTHELKTPLTAISGYAQTMRRVKLSEDDTDEALTYIHSECIRLEQLSRKMMKLLDFENGFDAQLETVSVQSLFDRASKGCFDLAAAREVSILTSSTKAVIQTDFDLMTDVLINLTDNAIKASSSKATVRLYATEADGLVIITVEDTGCGIPEEEQSKILEPFYTVDRSRCRKNGGCGLGLSLSALIIQKLGMRLEIESTVGIGTKMKIYISITNR